LKRQTGCPKNTNRSRAVAEQRIKEKFPELPAVLPTPPSPEKFKHKHLSLLKKPAFHLSFTNIIVCSLNPFSTLSFYLRPYYVVQNNAWAVCWN